jgi:hypothetical protein
MPQHDDHDDLAALDFYGADESDDAHAESDALDFSVADDEGDERSGVDALDEYVAAEPEDAGTELEAIDAVTEAAAEPEPDEEDNVQLFTVANPSETVAVSALIDGRTHRVDLSPKATSMSETELADEILVLADLARQKGLAGQHTYLLENATLSETMRDMGLDGSSVLRDFMENGMGLPTPEKAAEAQAEVFASRYATDHE